MYYGQTTASSNPRSRIVCIGVSPSFLELEIHSLDHTSHNGTHKSAYNPPSKN
jgi:hypothetical protein